MEGGGVKGNCHYFILKLERLKKNRQTGEDRGNSENRSREGDKGGQIIKL